MDDEHERLELDKRMRVAFAPDERTSARVVANALAASDARPSLSWRVRSVALTAVGLVILLAVFQWRRQAASPALAITGGGTMLVVESQDGRRWIVGHSEARQSGGSYVMVIPEDKVVK
jgi:hypothetical protein